MCHNSRKRPHGVISTGEGSLFASGSRQSGMNSISASISKRRRPEASPTGVEDQPEPQDDMGSETEDSDDDELELVATADHRDEIVAALLTITSALGLTKDTLHMSVSLLDRYMQVRSVRVSRLEALSIACLWIAVKFVETPLTIAKHGIKQILQRRRLTSNWTWEEILDVERAVLRALDFRVMAPTVLSLLQRTLYDTNPTNNQVASEHPPEQIQLAMYLADLLLLTSRANGFAKPDLVDAIVFITSGRRLQDVSPSLLAPVVVMFLAHRDNINPTHPDFKAWFALRCQYGGVLPSQWQVPFDPACNCRVCKHAQDDQSSRISPTMSATV